MTHPADELERAALEDLHAAAPPELCRSLGIGGRNIGSAFVSIAAALPASAIVINRAIGVGLRARESEATIGEMVHAYERAGVARYFVQVHPEARPPQIADWLLAQGLEKARGWQKFVRGRETVSEARTSLAIREIGAADAAASAAILCDAFDLGDQARPWFRLLAERERWHVFMSFDGAEPAGTGALFIDGDAGWLDFGATAPRFRRRGSQSALLGHRVRYALEHGCRQLYTCTGEDVPGDPQHSYSNILRVGFREDELRHNYAPPRQPA